MAKAIVTGANGFIGARLVRRLLERGWQVAALGRAKGQQCWNDRVKASLDDITGIPVDHNLLSGLFCYDANICRRGLDLSRLFLEHWRASKAVLFHVAGDTQFSSTDPDAQTQVNITGTLNVMRALRDVIRSAVHVSTAYVAGDRQGVILEDETDKGQTCRNTYEKSKLDTEVMVSDLCCQLGLPLAIVRPFIVINDTTTGRSSVLTHLNKVVEVINRVQKHYKIGDEEVVNEELRIPILADCRPNLVPVDSIVESFLEIGIHPRLRDEPITFATLIHSPTKRSFLSLRRPLTSKIRSICSLFRHFPKIPPGPRRLCSDRSNRTSRISMKCVSSI